MDQQRQTAVFLVHAIKQFTFGFETLNATADDNEDGSAAKAFYMGALYNYISAFFLLDRSPNTELGGAIPKALEGLDCVDLLDPIQRVLETRIGATTFGEIVRVFRNKVIVHTSYSDADLDRLYALVDMHDPANQARFHECLWTIYAEIKLLGLRVVERLGCDPKEFGVTVGAHA